mmetsp:Transcript_22801/g.70519  ORF Transcript_22801/g.70519 Transcript_22801/m.70519 type:complete len:363 (+) Transcript_22801:269-1357(+)
MAKIPVIDISAFVETGDGNDAACREIADALHAYGCLVVKDPRVDDADNETFLDMMERYFEQSDGATDARPHLHYQVGVTPAGVEQARNQCDVMKDLQDGALSECPPVPDAKWRFFWRVGPRPETSKFEELNAPAVVPDAFSDEWRPTMDAWGEKLVATAETVAEMAALGFGLEQDAFRKRMKAAPHLLAPTGSSLAELAKVPANAPPLKKPRKATEPVGPGTILAGFHYDLNFLSVHGKSRFPGLTVWTRDGRKTAPVIPPGHLLLQAGKQFEYLTGGHVLSGYHEVVAHEKCAAAARAAAAADRSTWRVSSTLFSHIASDVELKPLAPFDTEAAKAQFPPVLTGDQVNAELVAIKLGSGSK